MFVHKNEPHTETRTHYVNVNANNLHLAFVRVNLSYKRTLDFNFGTIYSYLPKYQPKTKSNLYIKLQDFLTK
jgi:hypothetical protein